MLWGNFLDLTFSSALDRTFSEDISIIDIALLVIATKLLRTSIRRNRNQILQPSTSACRLVYNLSDRPTAPVSRPVVLSKAAPFLDFRSYLVDFTVIRVDSKDWPQPREQDKTFQQTRFSSTFPLIFLLVELKSFVVFFVVFVFLHRSQCFVRCAVHGAEIWLSHTHTHTHTLTQRNFAPDRRHPQLPLTLGPISSLPGCYLARSSD